MRKKEFVHFFEGPISIKELIKTMGVHSEEVDLILLNGISVDFSSTLKDGDRASVYPIFETFDISGITRVRDTPLKEKRKV